MFHEGEHGNGDSDCRGELERASDRAPVDRIDESGVEPDDTAQGEGNIGDRRSGKLGRAQGEDEQEHGEQQTGGVADQVADDVGVEGRMQAIR